ncbi:hypothetical protein EBZ38_12425, partial [bacterium]|nr:hypothetical protein [bacterium]
MSQVGKTYQLLSKPNKRDKLAFIFVIEAIYIMITILLILYVLGCFVGHRLITNYFGEDYPNATNDFLVVVATIGSWLTFVVFFVNYL